MKLKYFAKAFSVSQKEISMLEHIQQSKGFKSNSEAIQFCIQQQYQTIKKESVSKKNTNVNSGIEEKLELLYRGVLHSLFEIINRLPNQEITEEAKNYYSSLRKKIEM